MHYRILHRGDGGTAPTRHLCARLGAVEDIERKELSTKKTTAKAVPVTRNLIWWLDADLKAWKRDRCPRRATALRARFDRIFTRHTGYVLLDRLLARLRRPCADREEKRVTYGNGLRQEKQLDPHNPNQRGL